MTAKDYTSLLLDGKDSDAASVMELPKRDETAVRTSVVVDELDLEFHFVKENLVVPADADKLLLVFDAKGIPAYRRSPNRKILSAAVYRANYRPAMVRAHGSLRLTKSPTRSRSG